MLEIIQIPVLNDNYIYILHEPESGETAVVDPAVSQPILDILSNKGWLLKYILNTHHHSDHVGANLALKQQTGCEILASDADFSRIPGIDKRLRHGDKISLGNQTAIVIATPGHTSGHIIFHFVESNALFCGDTLFSMGCGRLFEGTAEQMWESLQQIKKLPNQTHIYCAHEYTQANGEFALTLEPNNPQLLQRMQQVNELRAENKSTIPVSLKQELATNPFLRGDKLAIQRSIDRVGRSQVEVFAKIRELKDSF